MTKVQLMLKYNNNKTIKTKEVFQNVNNKLQTKRKKEKSENYKNKILTKSGALRDSIKSMTSRSALSTTVTSNLKYSAIHNDGLQGDAFGTSFEMPKRQFIGDSEKLNSKVDAIICNEINKLFI